MKISSCFVAAALLAPLALSPASSPSSSAQAATFDYSWPVKAGEKAPTVEISPLQWGKKWAYSVEIDDGPVSTLTVAQPLLANFEFSDAPPGVAGGRAKPFVGGAAIFLSRFDSGNSTLLNREQLQTLRKSGWEVLNHSYWHSGYSWDPKGALSEADIRRELFWSQALMAAMWGEGRAPSEFVYPNGYTKYGDFLADYGLRGASRVGATSKHHLDDQTKWLDLDRNYFDEGAWAKSNNPLEGLPDAPQQNDWIIDFTHGINGDATSANNKRWQARLEHIASMSGVKGDDSVWCAPTGAVAAYAQAAKAAKLDVQNGKVSLDVPDDLPGTPLTLHFSGLNPAEKLATPEGATLYQKGAEAWLTTPMLGKPGAPAPSPRLELIYSGEVKNVTFDKPRKIAGVRLVQRGNTKPNFQLQIDLVNGATSTPLVPPEKATLSANWGTWLLFPTIPDGPAPLASEVHVNSDPSLQGMEIWALAK